jgi:hypothetical protein
MKYLRNKRRLAGLGALAAVIGVTLWIVLPAVASNVGDRVGPHSNPAGQGVYPIDVGIGGNGVCSNLFPSLGGVQEYDNPNPKTGTYDSGNSDSVKFDLQMDPTDLGKDTTPAWAKGNYMNVAVNASGTAAKIVGIGINGGTDSTTYTYGGVSQDTYLHAPAQSWKTLTDSAGSYEWPSKLYGISHLTVCYALGSVSGTVKQDISGTLSGQQSWTLRLYDQSGTLIRTTTSDANGGYTFAVNFTPGMTYTVCEVPPSGSWAQETPGPSQPDLCHPAVGELPKGDQFIPSNASGSGVGPQNFVNVQGTACADTSFGIDNFQVKLSVPCSQKSNSFVFTSGTFTSGTDNYDWVGYWLGDQTQVQMRTPTVEYVKLRDPIDPSTNKPYETFSYSNDGGVAIRTASTALKEMLDCQRDPRDTNASGYPNSLALRSPYDTYAGSDGVLPTGETACAISEKVYVDANGQGWLEAYDYSLGDTIKGMR